jgi:hypothetical protein
MTSAQMRLTFEDGPAAGLDVDVDRAPTGPPRYVYVAVELSRVQVVSRHHQGSVAYWRQRTDADGGLYRLLPVDV